MNNKKAIANTLIAFGAAVGSGLIGLLSVVPSFTAAVAIIVLVLVAMALIFVASSALGHIEESEKEADRQQQRELTKAINRLADNMESATTKKGDRLAISESSPDMEAIQSILSEDEDIEPKAQTKRPHTRRDSHADDND